MAEKKSGLKRLFSKPDKACCSVEIEEVEETINDKCCGKKEENSENQQKEA